MNNKSSEKREERKLSGENLSHEQLKKIGGHLEENYCQVKSFHQAPIIMNLKKIKNKKQKGAKKKKNTSRHIIVKFQNNRYKNTLEDSRKRIQFAYQGLGVTDI